MTTTQQNRLDPSTIDREALNQLVAAFSQPGHVSLIDTQGRETQLPEPIYQHLMRIIRLMREGQAIIMLPEGETFTTQAAANFLGMSRQFFVDLLEKGSIPFHRVGSHRRVYFKDLLEYQKQRDQTRREGMEAVFDEIDEAGHYYPKD